MLLHPLVIINISDHATRARVRNGKNTRVVGVLLGNQQGKQSELLNSFELVVEEVVNEAEKSTLKIDHNYLQEKLIQCK